MKYILLYIFIFGNNVSITGHVPDFSTRADCDGAAKTLEIFFEALKDGYKHDQSTSVLRYSDDGGAVISCDRADSRAEVCIGKECIH